MIRTEEEKDGITIRDLKRKDEHRAMAFAATGMHFDRYCGNGPVLKLYTRYFWYLESGRATRIIAAYGEDKTRAESSVRGSRRIIAADGEDKTRAESSARGSRRIIAADGEDKTRAESSVRGCRRIIAADGEERLLGVLLAGMKGEPPLARSAGRRLYVRTFEFFQKIFSPRGGGLYESTNAELMDAYRQAHEPDGEILFLAADPETKVRGVGTALLKEFERQVAGREICLFTDNTCTWQFYEHRGFDRCGEKEVLFEMGDKKVPLTCLMYRKTAGEERPEPPEPGSSGDRLNAVGSAAIREKPEKPEKPEKDEKANEQH